MGRWVISIAVGLLIEVGLVLVARTTSLRRPRRGPLLHTTTWTRYRLASDLQQVREVQLAGVLSVA